MTTLHSKLGASSADRWMNCPASIRLSQGIPDSSNHHARKGTAAHEVGSTCLLNGEDAESMLDKVIAVKYTEKDKEETEEFTVDEEMCENVQIYLDTVRNIIAEYKAAGFTDADLAIEVKFDLTHIYPDMFGTCDCTIYLPQWRKMVVVDYKNGWGEVEAEDNRQMKYYALGALSGKHNRAIETLELVIVQPKSKKKPVKPWICDVVDLMDFRAELIEAADKTKHPGALANPGDHCQYCPASTIPGRCVARDNRIYMLAAAEFDDAGSIKLTEPEKLSLDKRKVIWENASQLEDWIDKMKTYIHEQALRGELLPGTKLVQGRKGHKKWKDETQAEKQLSALAAKGLIKDGIWNKKLKTPTQAEKDMGKDSKGLLDALWEQKEGKMALVHDSDSRPSATTDINKEFE